MATETRPGFRLPWAAGTDEPDDQPVAGDVPFAEEAQEADMIETAETADAGATAETAEPETAETGAAPEVVAEPETAATADSPPARRATKFMAELSRAMQAAAESARSETLARFEVEAKGVVEEIHANATSEAADLRRTADDDVAAVREWSKAEIARIREETEARIAARKSGLDGEMEEHAATVEARTERVAAVVADFEAQMSTFFERLNAEEDPTRIATMAETMPDPPSLADVAASIASAPVPSAERFDTAPEAGLPSAIDFAAAEAEAATFGDDLEGEDDELAIAESASPEDEAVADEAATAEREPAVSTESGSTRVIVSGLASVANIANFKRGLGRLPGVSTIAVASGPDGNFVFTVSHGLGSTLSASIRALTGFDIQITSESTDAISVAAQDRDTAD